MAFLEAVEEPAMHAPWFLFLLVSQVFHPLPAAAALVSRGKGVPRGGWSWAAAGVLMLVHAGLAYAWSDLATCLRGALWGITGAGAVGVFLGVRLARALAISCFQAPNWRCAMGLGLLGGVYALCVAFSWFAHMLSVDCGI